MQNCNLSEVAPCNGLFVGSEKPFSPFHSRFIPWFLPSSRSPWIASPGSTSPNSTAFPSGDLRWESSKARTWHWLRNQTRKLQSLWTIQVHEIYRDMGWTKVTFQHAGHESSKLLPLESSASHIFYFLVPNAKHMHFREFWIFPTWRDLGASAKHGKYCSPAILFHEYLQRYQILVELHWNVNCCHA